MIIIENLKNENGGYSNMQSWDATYPVPDEYAVWTDTLDDANFYAYNGFVVLTIEEVDGVDTVIAYEPNVEAWEAWKASLPDPEPEPEPVEDVSYDDLAKAILEGVNEV